MMNQASTQTIQTMNGKIALDDKTVQDFKSRLRGDLIEESLVLRRQPGETEADRPWVRHVSLQVLLRALHPGSRVRPVVLHEGHTGGGEGRTAERQCGRSFRAERRGGAVHTFAGHGWRGGAS